MRRRRLAAFVLAPLVATTVAVVAVLVSFRASEPPEPVEPTAALRDVRRVCPPAGADDYYFETDLVEMARELDPQGRPPAISPRQSRHWLSGLLAGANQASLSCGFADRRETYRWVSVGAFHNPIVVHVSRTDTDIRLTGFVTRDREGRTLDRHFSRSLSLDEWGTLVSALRAARFWATRAGLRLQPADVMDGGEDIIEGQRYGRYHLVGHWDGSPAFHAACLTFLRLAGVRPREDEIY